MNLKRMKSGTLLLAFCFTLFLMPMFVRAEKNSSIEFDDEFSAKISEIFPDSVLAKNVADKLYREVDENVCLKELREVKSLFVDGIIGSLEGIQYLEGLKTLSAWEEEEKSGLSDLKPLENLKNLEYLVIGNTFVKDISCLRGLTKLEDLMLIDNEIENIDAISGMTSLTYLSVSGNQITDFSPVSKLTKIETLWAEENNIQDINAIKNMTELQFLNFSNNNIKDLSVFTNGNFNKLTSISLNSNNIENIKPLSSLSNLVIARLEYNNISDVSAFKNSSELKFLYMKRNKVTDISPLRGIIGKYTEDGKEYDSFYGFNLLEQEITIPSIDLKGKKSISLDNIVTGLDGEAISIENKSIKPSGTYDIKSNKITFNNLDKSGNLSYEYGKYVYYLQEGDKGFDEGFSGIITANYEGGGTSVTVNKPSSPKVFSTNVKSVNLSWSKVANVDGYEVRYATSKNGTYKVAGTTAKTSFAHKKLSSAKTYYYKVYSYKKMDGITHYSNASSVVAAKTKALKPTSFKSVSNGFASVKLTWKKASKVTGYEVYRATSHKGKYSKVATVKTNKASYINNKLTIGKTYFYKIRSYKTTDGKTYYSDYTSIKSAKPIPKVPKGVKVKKSGSQNSAVSWKKISGATGYKIYRATSKNGKYKKIATVKSTKISYKDKGLKKGKTYYYKIKAYKKSNNKNIYSKYSKAVKLKR